MRVDYKIFPTWKQCSELDDRMLETCSKKDWNKAQEIRIHAMNVLSKQYRCIRNLYEFNFIIRLINTIATNIIMKAIAITISISSTAEKMSIFKFICRESSSIIGKSFQLFLENLYLRSIGTFIIYILSPNI